MISYLKSKLKAIDIYKTPLHLNVNGKSSTSVCGGIVTLIIVALSVLLFILPTMHFFSF